MKIKINVLPDVQKEKRIQEKKTSLVLRVGISSIAVLVLLNAILFLMGIVLNIEYQAAKKSSEHAVVRSIGEEKQSENIFREIGSLAATLSGVKAGLPHWARVLVRISEMSSEEIRVKSLAAEENRLKISGFAKTREALLSFQGELKKEGFQVPSNISNLVASRDFDFVLEVTVPDDYLTRK